MPHHHHLSPLIHRRSHAPDPHLNIRNATPDPQPEALAAPDANADPAAATVVSVVYVTAAKTFSGPVAGYSTIDPNANASPPVVQPTPSNANANPPMVQPTSSSVFSSSAQKASLPASSETRIATTTTQSPLVQSTSSSAPSIVESSIENTSQVLPTSVLQSTTDSETSTTQTPNTSSAAIATASSTTDGNSSPSSTAASSTSILLSTSSETSSQASSTSAVAVASSPSSTSDSSGGLSGGAKAGIALGVLLGVVALLGLLLFCYRRRKKHDRTHGSVDDEKNPFDDEGATFAAAGRAPSTRTARTASTAPRLSLRPVTQFLPNLGGNRKSTSNQLAMASAPSGMTAAGTNQNLTPSSQPTHEGSQWERPAGHGQPRANDPANPFGSHAEPSNHVPMTGATGPAAPVNPFGNDAQRSNLPPSGQNSTSQPPHLLNPSSSTPTGTMTGGHGGEIAAGAGVGVAAGLAAGASSRRHDESQPPEAGKPPHGSQARPASPSSNARNAQPSPEGTEYSMSSIPGTPIKPQHQAAAIPGAPAPNVHRVQLDFKPSMDDELELRAGQLVRMLHEYDDGWVCTFQTIVHV